MIRLLKLEYLKNISYKPFKIFTALYFLILIAMLFIGLVDIELSKDFKINLKEQGFYNFPGVWNSTTYFVAWLKIFLGMIIIFSITQEFTNRMFKQNVIDGLSRKEFIVSKLLTITVFTIFSTILVFGITLALGLSYSEKTDADLLYKEVFFIGHYFLKFLAFFSFLMFVSILLRKSIFVFLAFFVWWIAEGIFQAIERAFTNRNLGELSPEQKLEVYENTFFIHKVLPLESMSNLIPSPIFRFKFADMIGVKHEFIYPTESLIACIIWTVIFIAGSYWILKKRDW